MSGQQQFDGVRKLIKERYHSKSSTKFKDAVDYLMSSGLSEKDIGKVCAVVQQNMYADWNMLEKDWDKDLGKP